MSNQSNTSNDTPRTVQDVIDDIKEKSADGTYIFRGEPECYLEVSSSLWRECQPVAKVGMTRIQKQILTQAEEYDINRLGPSQSQRSYFLWSGDYNPFEYTERQFEILAEIQHWGGETNLIDFTTDYRVALFFACDGHYNKDGRIIVQDRGAIAGTIWEPTEPKHRVEAQKSVFVQPPNGFIKPDADQVICIPKTLKVPILKYLMRQDSPITTETIYNDLHGFITMQSRYRSAFVEFYIAREYEEQGSTAETLQGRHDAYKKAVNHYRATLELMPNLVMAHINCGRAHSMLEDFDSAIYHFNEAIDWKPDFADAYNGRGIVYGEQGDFDKAIDNFNKAIELNPDSVEAYSNRGNAYAYKGNYNRAIQDHDKAIELKPDSAKAYSSRGNAYMYKGNLDRAIENYDTAIQFNANHAEAYCGRGIVYCVKGNFNRAIEDLNMAIQLTPNLVEVYTNLGIVYETKGDIDRAIAEYAKAIQLKPDYASAYYNRSNAYLKKGDYKHVINDCTKAIALKLDYAEAYYNRGEAWLHLREWEKATSDLMNARDMGINIIAAFRNDYGSVESFEQITGIQLPADIAAMLTPQIIAMRKERNGEATHESVSDAEVDLDEIIRNYDRAWKTLAKP